VTVEVRLAPLLHAYTGGQGRLRASGGSLGAVLADLDRRHPGIMFRIVDEQGRLRRHMRCFVNTDDVRDLAAPVRQGDEIFIVGALSGG
jgi:molybdopterin converting factor small subunit